MSKNKMFADSILVVAHPDDEVLWFSSIIERVNIILICFIDYKPKPALTKGREKSLCAYPLKNIRCLGLEESESFCKANWDVPIISEYGLKLSDCKTYAKYTENFFSLRDRLEKYIVNVTNVFTHNPWGEYGHEDHVQVYRVLNKLNKKKKFNLWYSNYCSNRSINLARQYQSFCEPGYITFKPNKKLAKQIRNIYKKNECWTWYPGWEWCDEESFCLNTNVYPGNPKNKDLTHLNLIKIGNS